MDGKNLKCVFINIFNKKVFYVLTFHYRSMIPCKQFLQRQVFKRFSSMCVC